MARQRQEKEELCVQTEKEKASCVSAMIWGEGERRGRERERESLCGGNDWKNKYYEIRELKTIKVEILLL